MDASGGNYARRVRVHWSQRQLSMIDPIRLMRGGFLALALLFGGPLAGDGIPGLAAQPAMAQSSTLVASVLFEGNQRFSDAQLLTMVDTATGGAYTPASVSQDAESIRLAYDQAGFNNITVTPRAEQLENGRVRVTFTVNEGQRAGIAAINFTGNNAYNAGTLKGVINTKESGILSFLLRDDVYDEQKVAFDRELIRLYYANHGYPDAQVASMGQFDPQRNAYFVNFTINEGDRYSFGGVGIETSIAGLDTNTLRGGIETQPGGRYSYKDLQSSAENLAYQATSQGYSFADVRPRLDRDVANRTFNVTYLVDEGPRLYVERINITGNQKTRDFVIRRELGFSEGDPFNRSVVLRGKTAIERLGFFKSVQISTDRGSAPDKVVLNVQLDEMSTGEYGISAGYSTSDGILGELSVTERNFLGRGQYVRAALGATGGGKTFDLSFTEPHFLGLDISAGVDFYHRIIDEKNAAYYGSVTTGGQVRFGVPIVENVSASFFTGLEHKTITDQEEKFSALADDGDEINKAWVGYSLTYNGLDDAKKPTEGFYGSVSQKYVGWNDEFASYIESTARARYFLTLNEDWGLVGSLRGQAGVINSIDQGDVAAVEAFRPGASLVRGFEPTGLGPRLESGEYLGATMYAGLSAEVSFPFPLLPESYGLSGAVFADAGYISGIPDTGSGTFDEASNDEPLRTSIGASIIWDSPFGPLRGDFAHVLQQSTNDQSQVFQLTLQSLL